MPIPMAGADGRTAAEPVSAIAFRTLMAAFPAGVAVVTAADEDGQQYGMTCTAVSSVSVSPPTLLVCMQRSSRTLAVLNTTGTFAVNLLDDQARAVAELFASRNPDRFEHVSWTTRPGCGGPHLEQDAHSIADCRVTGSVNVADHVVVFGEIFRVTTNDDTRPRPLVYGMREYWSLGSTDAAQDHCAAQQSKPSDSDLVWWRNPETLEKWRNDPEHQDAQRLGRDKWYEFFELSIAEVVRTSSSADPEEYPAP